MRVISNDQVVVLSGTPQEQGHQLGEATAGLIRENVEMGRVEREAVLVAGISAADYDRALRLNEEFVSRISPETLEEIRGLAAGADIYYEDLLDLNLMTYFPMRRLMAECSQLLVAPPRSADGRWFLTKTRDMSLPSLVQTVVHRTYDDGFEVAEAIHSGAVTSPGSGLNSHGLSLSTSGVWPSSGRYHLNNGGRGWNLINPHLLLRDCRTVDEVEAALNYTSRLTGLNIVVMDGVTGARFEVTPEEVVRTNLYDGHLILTNHCASPQLKPKSPTREEYASTFDRFDRLEALTQANGQWTVEDVWRAVSDHTGYPNSSVCRHPDLTNTHSSVTAYASVATLPDQTFHVAMGNPCETSPIAHAYA